MIYLLVAIFSLLAQSDRASFACVVTDAANRRIEGARLTLVQGQEVKSLSTDADGLAQAERLPAGRYSITVEAVGFEPYTSNLDLQDTKTALLTVCLSPGYISEIVEVRAAGNSSAKTLTLNAPFITSSRMLRPTEEARGKGIRNAVLTITAVLGKDGKTRDISLKKGAGFGLDEKALKLAGKLKFKPALLDGAPVDARCDVQFYMTDLELELLVIPASMEIARGARKEIALQLRETRPDAPPGKPEPPELQAQRSRVQNGGIVLINRNQLNAKGIKFSTLGVASAKRFYELRVAADALPDRYIATFGFYVQGHPEIVSEVEIVVK